MPISICNCPFNQADIDTKYHDMWIREYDLRIDVYKQLHEALNRNTELSLRYETWENQTREENEKLKLDIKKQQTYIMTLEQEILELQKRS